MLGDINAENGPKKRFPVDQSVARIPELLESISINHMTLNPRFNQADIEEPLKRLVDDLLAEF